MPQKTIAIQSLNCTYFLNYSGNQTFLLIKNRDAKKPSAFNKSTSFFPHRVLILTIFGTVEVFSLALNCVGISSPKGILDQPTTGAFAISVSLTVWHVTKLERSFFFPVTKHTGSWTTPVKLQLEAWHNGAQPLRAQFTVRNEMCHKTKVSMESGCAGPPRQLLGVVASVCSQQCATAQLVSKTGPCSKLNPPMGKCCQHKICFAREIPTAIRKSTTACPLVGASC